jgi:hypothetical protein
MSTPLTYDIKKETGLYLVTAVDNTPLTLTEENRYKVTMEHYYQIVKVTNPDNFKEYLQLLCRTKPNAKVSYQRLCDLEDILEF